ncbi:hypothetical protein L2E82_00730 [Cichorium intybus]|uniref:Uncharacterized protein n=1 Tax=Cichorium intybus TaxID=13427 RepID=A0ACB9GY17_CICIN|nr:hypothetical protein L2E82_00730 [Cichorium intybus]
MHNFLYRSMENQHSSFSSMKTCSINLKLYMYTKPMLIRKIRSRICLQTLPVIPTRANPVFKMVHAVHITNQNLSISEPQTLGPGSILISCIILAASFNRFARPRISTIQA